MSHAIICDGCGDVLCYEPIVRGYAIRRHYCLTCDEKAKVYESDVDGLHTQIANGWMAALASLRDKHGKQLKALPDV